MNIVHHSPDNRNDNNHIDKLNLRIAFKIDKNNNIRFEGRCSVMVLS